MDPFIQNWAQSADAQPYLQQVMGAQGGYGMGGVDPYSQYLMQLINANPQDTGFQDKLLGYYLDYTNPMNQQRSYVDENKLNTALSLLSSDSADLQGMGQALLQEAYPQLAQTGYGINAQPQTYGDVRRQEARDILKDPSTLGQEDFNWYRYLSQAPDESISAYDASIPLMERSRYAFNTSGLDFTDPLSITRLPAWWGAFLDSEAQRRVRSGYGDSSVFL